MKYHLTIVWRTRHSPWDQGATHGMFLENEEKKAALKSQGTLSDVYFNPVIDSNTKTVLLEFTDRESAESYESWIHELAVKYNKYLISTAITEI